MTTSTPPNRVEPLYVLYGSQMGNSEGAAKEFCNQLKELYTSSYFEQHGLPSNISVETKCISLDDFLEFHHASFTRCLVIFVSSYGVGQAPLGAYRFRELCDGWVQSTTATTVSTDDNDDEPPLQGLKYAICGLGDSSYPTKFKNPTIIDQGLTKAGAERIGDLALADANGMGEDEQEKTIAKWMTTIWLPLAKELTQPLEQEAPMRVDTKKMQRNILPLLIKLIPDYKPPNAILNQGGSITTACPPTLMALVGILVAVVAIGTALMNQ